MVRPTENIRRANVNVNNYYILEIALYLIMANLLKYQWRLSHGVQWEEFVYVNLLPWRLSTESYFVIVPYDVLLTLSFQKDCS